MKIEGFNNLKVKCNNYRSRNRILSKVNKIHQMVIKSHNSMPIMEDKKEERSTIGKYQ